VPTFLSNSLARLRLSSLFSQVISCLQKLYYLPGCSQCLMTCQHHTKYYSPVHTDTTHVLPQFIFHCMSTEYQPSQLPALPDIFRLEVWKVVRLTGFTYVKTSSTVSILNESKLLSFKWPLKIFITNIAFD
jgi:hypothetical protein